MYEDADEDGAPNLYVHHDIILPAFPLSLAWMDCHLSDSSQTANLAAVRACPELDMSVLLCQPIARTPALLHAQLLPALTTLRWALCNKAMLGYVLA